MAISFAAEAGLSPVQLQKCLFLLGRQLKKHVGEDFYEFFPYDYGPFCKAVYQDAEVLASEGLIFIERPSGGYATYRITPKGARRARQLSREGPAPAVKHLRTVIEWALPLSFSELVRAIYNRYPEYRTNSVFQF